MADATPFPPLNRVLRELVDGVHVALGDNLVGVYLQGSFAVGDADEYSDVDFVVVTHRPLSREEQSALQELHWRLHELDDVWAPHLEGSYVPKDLLRRVDTARTPLYYLDNGARDFTWDDHCNTSIVRWSLREHGIALAGPPPAELVDPVSPDDLRAEALRSMRAHAEWARAGFERYLHGDGLAFSRWKQPYLVTSYCRTLHTLGSGSVASKREAGEWALEALDRRWAPLIRRALDDRPDPWQRVHQPAERTDVEATMKFIAYALEVAQRPRSSACSRSRRDARSGRT